MSAVCFLVMLQARKSLEAARFDAAIVCVGALRRTPAHLCDIRVSNPTAWVTNSESGGKHATAVHKQPNASTSRIWRRSTLYLAFELGICYFSSNRWLRSLYGMSTSAGNSTQNSAPPPSLGSTPTRPPWA